jgi:hypothetical protein
METSSHDTGARMVRFRPVFPMVAVVLTGCLSISSTEPTPSADLSGYCSGMEAQCREVCGAIGVQAFACNARPGQEISYRCECRKPAKI